MGDLLFCGWRLQSDMALPELNAWVGDPRRTVDLVLRRGPAPEISGVLVETPFLQVGRDRSCRLAIPTFGAFLIRDGKEIVVDATTPSAETELPTFLYGTLLRIVALQRGLLALPAAAVDAGGAIVLAGRSGSGKSAAAARFAQRGHRVLADDIAVIEIEDEPKVRVVAPSLKLWRDTVDMLGLSVPASPPTRRSQERYRLTIQPGEADGGGHSLPMRAIFLLCDEVREAEALLPAAAASDLLNRATAGPFAAVSDARTLTRSAQYLARHIPVIPVQRAMSFGELDAWLDALEERARQ